MLRVHARTTVRDQYVWVAIYTAVGGRRLLGSPAEQPVVQTCGHRRYALVVSHGVPLPLLTVLDQIAEGSQVVHLQWSKLSFYFFTATLYCVHACTCTGKPVSIIVVAHRDPTSWLQ